MLGKLAHSLMRRAQDRHARQAHRGGKTIRRFGQSLQRLDRGAAHIFIGVVADRFQEGRAEFRDGRSTHRPRHFLANGPLVVAQQHVSQLRPEKVPAHRREGHLPTNATRAIAQQAFDTLAILPPVALLANREGELMTNSFVGIVGEVLERPQDACLRSTASEFDCGHSRRRRGALGQGDNGLITQAADFRALLQESGQVFEAAEKCVVQELLLFGRHRHSLSESARADLSL